MVCGSKFSFNARCKKEEKNNKRQEFSLSWFHEFMLRKLILEENEKESGKVLLKSIKQSKMSIN